MFAGKDFLKMTPPPGYKPGIGRGAVGFTTERERPFPAPKRLPRNEPLEQARFDDADEADGAIWDAIESRRKRKRILPLKNTKDLTDTKISAKSQVVEERKQPKELSEVSIDEWAKLPEATDTTRSNKRIRETEQSMRRSYAPPGPKDSPSPAALRPVLERMIQSQPHNPDGYLKLARIEQEANRLKQARQIVERGTLKAPNSVALWLASIELHPELSQARQIAAKACKTVPGNEELWLAALKLEPTRALKRQLAHEALLACPSGENLWMEAASLEDDADTKRDVLQTATEFVDSSRVWLELSRISPLHLATARSRFPNDRDIWFASIAHDAALVPQAVDALPRSDWLAFLANTTADSPLSGLIAQSLKLSLEEVESLPHLYRYVEPSVGLYLRWAAREPAVLRKAVKRFPESEVLLMEYVKFALQRPASAEPNDADWAEILTRRHVVSQQTLQDVADILLKQHEHARATEWLHGRAKTPVLWLQYIEASNIDAEALIDEGLAKWPGCATFYLEKVEKNPNGATEILKSGLKHANGEDHAKLLLALAEREPSIPRRRALLAQALAQHPGFAPLWLARVQLERNGGKPVAHILSDALKRFPTFVPLWLEDLLSTPPAQRKRRLAEAVRQTGGNKEVLFYGAMYFSAVGNKTVADEWLARSGKTEASLGSNPFL